MSQPQGHTANPKKEQELGFLIVGWGGMERTPVWFLHLGDLGSVSY